MKLRNIVRIMMVLSLILGGLTHYSYGAESHALVTAHTRASLVSDHDAIDPGHPLRLGLLLELKKGWHTYWQNPGDAGDAPNMDIVLSGAVLGKGGAFSWPTPERISEGGLMAYAYQGRVLLPQLVHITSVVSEGQTEIKAHAEWLVCADLCVPEEGDFTLSLPRLIQGDYEKTQSKEYSLFQQADAQKPKPSSFQADIASNGILSVFSKDFSSSFVKDAWFLPYENGVIKQNAPQKLEIKEGKITLALQSDPTLKPPFWQKSLKGVLVLVNQNNAHSSYDIEAKPSKEQGTEQGTEQAQKPLSIGDIKGPIKGIIPGSLYVEHERNWDKAFHYLLFAFLGGLILNLMPCVFPVLAMKALSLVRIGGGERHEQIASGVFYTIGVMGSFLILGALMIILRMIGSVAGWGFQFQSPGFVIVVCWLLLLMALNLLGVFQITGGRFAGNLGQIANKQGYYGDMLAGLLAVIVATPCTAPFMGVAIAGALSGPIILGLLIFLAMGLGLAFPYLLVACVPYVAAKLPRPGAWMEILKQFLAFPLLATCVWLLWVAVLQRGADFAALGAGGGVLLGFASWLYGLAQHRVMREGGARVIGFYRLIALLCVLVSFFALYKMLQEPQAELKTISMVKDSAIEPFSEERLAELRAQHRPVFVDMTASWCITCMVNERVALNVTQVQNAFKARHIVTLRGDWTNKDEKISAYLKKQGRDGVPLYMYYPKDGAGKQLPQILTPSIILNNL